MGLQLPTPGDCYCCCQTNCTQQRAGNEHFCV